MSIGEAWDPLELDLKFMEAENGSDYPPISTIYHSIPVMEEKGMEGEGNGRLGLISQYSEAQHSEVMLS